jgi:hypothetical protein
VAFEEGPGGVGAVDLEALVLGGVAFDQPDVVEHRADVEQLGVASRASVLSGIGIPAIVVRRALMRSSIAALSARRNRAWASIDRDG